ncbi:MAG: helix-turn-helix transcriptional regulator [Pseudomonadales bacterium]|jgi:DNA-binding CsgD family transcriptional regulator
MSDDVHVRGSVLAAITLFGTIGVLVIADLMVDYGEGSSWYHLAAEGAVLLAAVGGVALLWLQMRRSRFDLVRVRAQAEQWRRENQALLAGLSEAIDRQFEAWQLTAAESEVARLLLKGLSHKEIAGLRHTSERTIREQARSVYRKGGLTGRAGLSAFFLEDLLVP